MIAVLFAIVGALGLTAAPALAAAPEAPTVQPPSLVRATLAELQGTLNPGKEGEPDSFELDTYEFVYRPSTKGECRGAGEVLTPAGMSLGAGKEAVSQVIEGLTADTEYAVCLVAHNEADTEESTSVPLSFATSLPPETPTGEQALEVTGTTAKLKGVLNPGAAGEPGFYRFSYAPSKESCTGAESVSSPPEPGEPSAGAQGEAVETLLSGLLPDTSYTFCLIARNSVNEEAEGAPVTFTTLTTVPVITGEAASGVGVSTATVRADISPGGLSSTYHVEYLTQARFAEHGWSGATRVPSSDAELPASSTPVPVSETLSGLQAGTTYRFRFVATNTLGEVPGTEEATFTTGSSGAVAGLPDGRVDELVSTSGSTGEPYSPTSPEYGFATPTNQLFQAAANGEAIAYIGEPATTGGNGGIGNGEGNEWLATRSSSGWNTGVITPAGSEVGTVYQAFSENLTTGIFESKVQPPLAAGAPSECQVLYSRASGSGAYTALLTNTETPKFCGHPLFAGATEDESQVIFESEAALTANAEEATEVPAGHPNGHIGGLGGSEGGEPCTFGCNLYDEEGGHLRLVNVLPGPEETTVPNATFGGYPGENPNKTDFSGAISRDGSRIFWTDTQSGADMEHVYVLENGTSEVQVSGAGAAQYWTATPDGRYAYYTEAGELWRFDTSAEAGPEPHEALASNGLKGENAGVLGVVGINSTGEDGAYVYFVADGVLAGNENANGETAERGQEEGNPNLYLRHGNATTFIATLAPRDNQAFASTGASEAYGDWVANVGDRTAEVTPDGTHLVFESIRSLTGYDNHDGPNEDLPVSEVFVYNAGATDLACASCTPSGASPQVFQKETQTLLPISGESNNTSMRHWISENGGRVFFDSKESLVPQDTNGGKQDVYEWESEGEGSCSVQAPPRLNRGCVFLLSGGESEDMSFLIDAGASGQDVFFTHRGALGGAKVPSDQNELYDARIGGGFPQTLQGCSGGGCQSAPTPTPAFTPPATATFSGPGNFPPATVVPPKKKTAAQIRAEKLAHALKSCKKDKSKKKRAKCEKSARKSYGAKRAKKAGNARRAQS